MRWSGCSSADSAFHQHLRSSRPHRNRACRSTPPHQGRCARLHRAGLDPADDVVDGGFGGAAGGGAAGRSAAHRDGLISERRPRAPRPRCPADWFDDLPPAVPSSRSTRPIAGGGRNTNARLHDRRPSDAPARRAAAEVSALPQHRAAPACGASRPGGGNAHRRQAGITPKPKSRWSSRPSMMATD